MRLFWLFIFGFLVPNLWGQSSVLLQTKEKIQHLNKKIVTAQHQLTHAKVSHQEVNKVVTSQEKKMLEVKAHLSHLVSLLQKKQTRINQLTQKERELNVTIQRQQQLLAQYIGMRYRLGKDWNLKMVVNMNSIHILHQRLIYSQYLIASYHEAIKSVRENQTQLFHTQALLKQDLESQVKLKKMLNQTYARLAEDKNNKLTMLSQLDASIKTQQEQLEDYERDKKNLNALLVQLVKEANVSQRSAQVMAHTSFPFKKENGSIISWNQGLLFLAPEGTAVKALQAGKVVFSDWLRGYVYLVIIDHGQGVMTLYGYNHALYKHQGEKVNQYEQIATVGHSGMYRESGVYFEVRKQGKILSAQTFLNKKSGHLF